MDEYMSWGVKAVKMKVGGVSMKEDAQRVKAVRQVIGEETKLLMDANCSYRFFEAIEFGKMVEEYHPTGSRSRWTRMITTDSAR